MKNFFEIRKTILLIITFLLINGSALFPQDAQKEKKMTDMHKMKSMKDMKHETDSVLDSTIVRKGIIDLIAIDNNKDGKVFQCPMDANVISDVKSDCPECGMSLQEVTIEDAKAKLLRRGFKVAETTMKSGIADSGKNMTKMNQKAEMAGTKSIVREGVIDLSKIDANKDGKVYQDQMDWNVISDKPGKCPLCKMTLKEVTLEEAKKNLIEHNFKVK